MAKHIIDKNKNSTVDITQGKSEWTLTKGHMIAADIGFLNTDWDKVKIKVDGRINAYEGGVLSLDQVGSTDKIKVIVSSSGFLDCYQNGVFIMGDKASVINDGRIYGNVGVGIDGNDAVVKNDGKIVSDSQAAVIVNGGEDFLVTNNGLLRGGAAVLVGEASGTIVNEAKGVFQGEVEMLPVAGDVEFINKGKVIGNDPFDDIAVQFGDGDDKLVNLGTIRRQIHMGGGDDVADLRGGKLTDPVIHGGTGDDMFYIDNAKIDVMEIDGEGYDSIRTSVSYKLADGSDVEYLQAIGKKAIDLTGNEFTNVLVGNSAKNSLDGGNGLDILWGNGGNDTLSGGSMADIFCFKANSGADKVTDFSITEDIIQLVKIDGIDTFGDLSTRMTQVDADNDGQANDAVIDLGDGDKITLIGVNKDMLDTDNFVVLV